MDWREREERTWRVNKAALAAQEDLATHGAACVSCDWPSEAEMLPSTLS
jgi:hypothetical protein